MIGIVSICYENSDEVVDFFSNKENHNFFNENIVVVVNNSYNSKHFVYIKNEFRLKKYSGDIYYNNNFFLINSKINLGFAKGNNKGADFLIQNFPKINTFIFTNTDIKIYKLDINYIQNIFEKYPDVGIIGPKITDNKGIHQNPISYQNAWRNFILPKLLGPIKIFLPYKFSPIQQNAKNGIYDYLSGAFLIIRSKAFIDVGGFDNFTFLYNEEKILGKRMINNGYKCYYFNDAFIKHYTGKTTRKNVALKKILIYQYNGLRHFYKNYINVSRLTLFFIDFAHFVNIKFWSPIMLNINKVCTKK